MILKKLITKQIGIWVVVSLSLTAVNCQASETTGDSARTNRVATPSGDPTSELHLRIAAANAQKPDPDPKVTLARLAPLFEAAHHSANLSLDDRIIVTKLYAQALYEDGQEALAADTLRPIVSEIEARDGASDSRLIELYKNLGIYLVHSNTVEAGSALEARALDLALAQAMPDQNQIGLIHCALAFAASEMDKLKDEMSHYESCLERLEVNADTAALYAAYLGNYATSVRTFGDYEKALDLSLKAQAISEQYLSEGHKGIGWALFNVGENLMQLNRPAEAEAVYARAFAYATKYQGAESFEAGVFAYGLGRSLVNQDKAAEAGAIMLRAVAILKVAKNGGVPDMESRALLQAATMSASQLKTDEALSYGLEALRLLDDAGLKSANHRAAVNRELARLYLQTGNAEKAKTAIDLSLTYYRGGFAAYNNFRVSAEMVNGVILCRLGQSADALSQTQPIFEAMQARMKNDAVSRSELVAFAKAYQLNFSRFIEIALINDRPDLAFKAAQLASFSEIAATSLSLAARSTRASPEGQILARRLQDGQEHRQSLERERTAYIGKSPSDAKRVETALTSLDADLAALRAGVARDFPQYEALARPTPLDLAHAQAQLKSGQAYLLPIFSEDHALSLVVTGRTVTYDRVPILRAEVALRVQSIKQSIGASRYGLGEQFDRSAALQLGGVIFTPKIRAALKGIEEVSVVGSGPIMTIPLTILLLPAKAAPDYVIQHYAISVKSGFLAGANETPSAKSGFLGIGDPRLGSIDPIDSDQVSRSVPVMRGSKVDMTALKAMPSLPQTKVELIKMRDALAYPDSALLLGRQATETEVKRARLDTFRIIAFATHGLIGGDLNALKEPALVLTPPDVATDEDDGLLTASDIAGLHLNAEWIILSACNTGLGRDEGAAGYSGLTRAFMQAGAQHLLVSLWPVRDDVAQILSVGTVKRAARGLAKAKALRAATLNLMQSKTIPGASDPSVWGPFSLVQR